jgi:uncharacterized membrane protein
MRYDGGLDAAAKEEATAMTTTGKESGSGHTLNLAVVLSVHFVVGFFWLFAVGGIFGAGFGWKVGTVWSLSAAVTWLIDGVRIGKTPRDPAEAWGLTFLWWAKTFVAPVIVALEVVRFFTTDGEADSRRVDAPAVSAPPPPSPPPSPPVNRSHLTERLDEFARRLAGLESELLELRRLAAEPTPSAAATGPAQPPPAAAAPSPPPPPSPQPSPPPAARPAPPPPPTRPSFWDREVTFEDLFGAKALAWAGGAVTLLGIVFFFVLAVNRGWVGPEERVGLGALASVLVFGAGFYVRHAYGYIYSALAAAGAGIAGGYATLLAATALYELVPQAVALIIAAALAGVGVATALAWSSELIAGIGLIGATLAPAAIAVQDGEPSAIGTGFAVVMFAATAGVTLARRWQPLLGIGLVAALPQVAALVADGGVTDWDVVAVTAVFWLLCLGSAIGLQMRLERPALASLPSTLVLVGALTAGVASAHLFAGRDEGWILLAVAAVHAALAAALFPRSRERDVSAFLGVVALAIGAVAVAQLLEGPALAIAWAAEAAVLAWLARRVDEVRYQVVSLAYLVGAAVIAFFREAPLEQLYRPVDDPASGVAAVAAVAVAAAISAWYSRPWENRRTFGGVFVVVAPILEGFREVQRFWRSLTGWSAALSALYAASLGVLAFAQWISESGTGTTFDWAHVAVTGLWGLAALAVLALGHRIGSLELRTGALAWLGAVLLQAVFFDTSLAADPRGYAFLAAGAALLGGGLVDRLVEPEAPAFAIVAALVLASVGLGVAGALQLTDGDWEGYSLLGLAALYSVLAIYAYFRDRDLSTLLWAPALVVAGYAATLLLDGTWLVLAWAATAAALAWLADSTEERRLQLASFGLLVFAAGHALGIEAPPAEFFEANATPADGVPALLLVIGATAVFGLISRGEPDPLPEQPSDYEQWAYSLKENQPLWRATALGASALLAIYAGSLAILGLAEAVGGATVATDFQRGHTGVSAFWGLIGLVALYVGLSRALRWLRVAGFALFGLALAKLFLYDLAFLSSITRALSFLAVGAVLLFAGFLVQKLGAERDHAAT